MQPMASIIRSFAMAILVSLGGDATGLTIYYLRNVKRWAGMEAQQIALLVLITLLVAVAEAFLHGSQKHGRSPAELLNRYTLQYLITLLITLMLTIRPS